MQPRVKRILLTLLVLALAIFFYGVFGRNILLLTLENESVTLSGPDSSVCSVPYSNIVSMELHENFDPGAAVDGGIKNHIRYGLWNNDKFGNYNLFVSEKINPVIILQTDSGEVLVFNYESEKTTRSFYESFTGFLLEQGYNVTAAPIS